MKYQIKSEECWKNALNLVAHFEGLRLNAYTCPAGYLSIGYGHRMDAGDVRQITSETAKSLLVADFGRFVDAVHDIFPYLWEGQLFALASLSYNLGLSWVGKDKNLGREVRALNNRQMVSGSDVKLQYNVTWYMGKYCYHHVKGKPVLSEGLRQRRLAEIDLFNGELHYLSNKK